MEALIRTLADGAVVFEEFLEWCTADDSSCTAPIPIDSTNIQGDNFVGQHFSRPSVFRQAFLAFVRHEADALLQPEQPFTLVGETSRSPQSVRKTSNASLVSAGAGRSGHAAAPRRDSTSAAPTLSEKNFPSLAAKSNATREDSSVTSNRVDDVFSRPVGGSSKAPAGPSRRIAVTKVSSTYVDPAFAPGPDGFTGLPSTSAPGAGQWQKPLRFPTGPSLPTSSPETSVPGPTAWGPALRKENKQPQPTKSGQGVTPRLPGIASCSPTLSSPGQGDNSPTVAGGPWCQPLSKILLSSQAQSASSSASVVVQTARSKGKGKACTQQSIPCLSQHLHRPSHAAVKGLKQLSTSSFSQCASPHLQPSLAQPVATSSSYASAASAPAHGEGASGGKSTPRRQLALESTPDTPKSVTSRLSFSQSKDSRLLDGRGCSGEAASPVDREASGLGFTSLGRGTVYEAGGISTGVWSGEKENCSAEARSDASANVCAEHGGLPCGAEDVTCKCRSSCVDERSWTRMAKVHGRLLSAAKGVPLMQELNLLLHLTTLSSSAALRKACVCSTASAHERKALLLCCARLASAYACAVLLEAGNVLAGFGPSLLEALANNPAVSTQCPKLVAAIEGALQEQQRGRGEGRRTSEAGESRMSGHANLGLQLFVNDGQRSRLPEEQDRINNREACRDEWMALLHDAAGLSQSAFAPAASGVAGNEEAVLDLFARRAPSFLKKLRHDNMPHFATLFTAAVLQAAATGESFLDDELSRLANRDLSKFALLQDRLKGKGAGGKLTGRQPNANYQSRGPASGKGTVALKDEGSVAKLAVAGAFPAHQRVYILFLQAADSDRLNTHLARCMQLKVEELWLRLSNGSGGSHGEHAVLLATLGLFLSFLRFAAAGIDPSDCWDAAPGQEVGFSYTPQLDVELQFRSACATGTVLETLCWVSRYFWFLGWDKSAAKASSHRRVLSVLAQLHNSPVLQAGHAAFCPAALCARCVLDDFNDRAANTGLTFSLPDAAGTREVVMTAQEALGRSVMDARLFQLCCPGLTACRQALQVASGASSYFVQPKAVRKITPSQPPQPHTMSVVPDRVAMAAAPATDPGRVRLQKAFVDMYSQQGKRVLMKDLIAQVSELASSNALQAAIDALCNPTAVAICSSLQAEGLPQAVSETLSGTSQRIAVLTDVNGLLAEVTPEVLLSSYDFASAHIDRTASMAFSALSCPEWTPAVVGTGAALAAEAARRACAKRLIAEVPSKVHTAMMHHLRSSNAGAKKGEQQVAASAE